MISDYEEFDRHAGDCARAAIQSARDPFTIMEWGGKLVRGGTEVGYAYTFLCDWTVIDAGPEA